MTDIKDNYEISVSSNAKYPAGIEKIEPLKVPSVFNNIFSNEDTIKTKLNEVIEKVNMIMDYLEGVKK